MIQLYSILVLLGFGMLYPRLKHLALILNVFILN